MTAVSIPVVIDALTDALHQPPIAKTAAHGSGSLALKIQRVIELLQQYERSLEQAKAKSAVARTSTDATPAVNDSDRFHVFPAVVNIKPTDAVLQRYKEAVTALRSKAEYEVMDLSPLTPEEKRRRSEYIRGFTTPFRAMVRALHTYIIMYCDSMPPLEANVAMVLQLLCSCDSWTSAGCLNKLILITHPPRILCRGDHRYTPMTHAALQDC